MRRANLPLDPEAVKKANASMKAETGGRSLSMGPEDAALRKKWMDAYIEAAGPNSYTSTKTGRKKPPEPVQKCHLKEKNFVELQYSHSDGKGVAGASYEVIDLDTKGVVASGTLDDEGYSYASLPLSTKRIKHSFYNDPGSLTINIKPIKNEEQPKDEEGLLASIASGGVWIWGALKGDFNEDPTVGQIALNTVITLIPYVDQAGDARDITANLKFLIIDERYNEKMVWFALVVTIIGCVPEVGSLVKGVLKVILKDIKAGKKIPVEKLIEVFNYFAKGNAVKYLKELSAKLPEYGKFAKDKIKEILRALIDWLEKASSILPEKLSIQAKNTKKSAENVLASVDNNVDEVVNDIKKNLDESLKEPVDLSKEGNVKTINERKQVASAPPELNAQNASLHESYKTELRKQMEKPFVQNEELKELMDKQYRPNAKVGSGSTADAIRSERATGQPVGGRFHSQKGNEAITALERWIKNNPNAKSGDIAAAQNVILDLKNALGL